MRRVDATVSRCGRGRWVGVSGDGQRFEPERRPHEETILRGAPDRPPERRWTPAARTVRTPPATPVAPEAPIYAELVRRWQAEGRAVPGLPDPAWESPAAPAGAQPSVSGSGRSPFAAPAWSPDRGSAWNPGTGSEWSPG